MGGTNPGLLEALSVCKMMYVYDVSFNKYIAEDTVLYFDSCNKKLSDLINKTIDYTDEQRNKFGIRSRKLMDEQYKWIFVVKKYKEEFDKIINGSNK